jgi:hypothetical protein
MERRVPGLVGTLATAFMKSAYGHGIDTYICMTSCAASMFAKCYLPRSDDWFPKTQAIAHLPTYFGSLAGWPGRIRRVSHGEWACDDCIAQVRNTKLPIPRVSSVLAKLVIDKGADKTCRSIRGMTSNDPKLTHRKRREGEFLRFISI